jgi:hypothetical protein
MPRKPRRAHLDRANCDTRMRKWIHARGQCQRCGDRRGPFECAHIVRRSRSWTRTDERNAWCLCHDCHRTVDTVQSEFLKLVEQTIGMALLEELERKSLQGGKFDWAAELVRWKQMNAEVPY